jgi:hypothetical protein
MSSTLASLMAAAFSGELTRRGLGLFGQVRHLFLQNHAEKLRHPAILKRGNLQSLFREPLSRLQPGPVTAWLGKANTYDRKHVDDA